jgi:lipoyl-dependent peroxiredoxin
MRWRVAGGATHRQEKREHDMKRSGSAIWSGAIKAGQGRVSTESGVLDGVNYSFAKRFGDEPGTNPEELIGAAHSACFSMALAGVLDGMEMTADEIATTADVTIEKAGEGFAINAVHLTVRARIPGADGAKFKEAAETAKANCPVSKVLNATITMNAALQG